MSLQEFKRIIRAYSKSAFQGDDVIKFTMHFFSGAKYQVPVEEIADSSEPLTQAEQKVLDQVPPYGKGGATSQKIQNACGHKNYSHFMKLLRQLCLKGSVIRDADGRYQRAS